METRSIYDFITAQFKEGLPFVAYHKPNENKIKTIFLDEDEVSYTSNFTKKGFVFAPFDTTQEAIFFPGDRIMNFPLDVDETEDFNSFDIPEDPEVKAQHIHLVEKAIATIKEKGLVKVVLSRKRTLNISHLNPAVLFKKLVATYPSAMTYCWYHPKIGLWVGATPEVLLSLKGNRFQTMSLAGTQAYAGRTEVTWGTKEIDEQQLVTDTIVRNLNTKVDQVTVGGRQTHRAGRLLHLKTKISGTVDVNQSGLKNLITALHPTPAVCGLPKHEAAEFILENENYNREYYTGFLGEINLDVKQYRSTHRRNVENLAYTSVRSESHLFVNLRCMQLQDNKAHVYVGGGIIAASNPEAEWEETQHKLSTMAVVLKSFI